MITRLVKPDEKIERQVYDELHWDCRTESSPTAVSVAGGIVTLTGAVKYYAIRRAAEEAALRVAGVEAVQDNIVVRIPPGKQKTDEEIAAAIRFAFEWNVLIPEDQVHLIVRDGVVTLYGTMDCIRQREEAERAVTNLHGVREIINDLVVEDQPIEAESVWTGIVETLERQALADARKVTIDVDGGAVRLSGLIPSYSQRSAAVTAAGFAHGVQRVVDDMKFAATI
jgi:osmotically-inducible protein OsmY